MFVGMLFFACLYSLPVCCKKDMQKNENPKRVWPILFWLKSDIWCTDSRTTDTQWRHKSKISEKLGRCGRQNMLRPYLKIWDWDWIFGRAVKAISSLGVRSPWPSLHTVAIWTFTFHKKSGFVRVILKANFNSTYKPNSSMFWSETQIY